MSKTNLEFRKIPSLRFQYEISTDGRYVRNVKSKKYCHIFEKDGEYYFRVRNRREEGKYLVCSILQICKECGIPHISNAEKYGMKIHKNEYVISSRNDSFRSKVQVTLGKEGLTCPFESIAQAATYIAEHTGHEYESIRRRMQHRRAYILGYEVFYRNAETVHR